MATVPCTAGQARPPEVLACTRFTRDALPRLVPPCAAACQARMAAWRLAGATPGRTPVARVSARPPPDAGSSAVLPPALPADLPPPRCPGTAVRQGPAPSAAVAPRPPARPARGPAPPRRCPRPVPAGARPAARGRGDRRRLRRRRGGGGAGARRRRPRRPASRPPCAHDGTARRRVRPPDPAAPPARESGKKKAHTVNHVLLVHALLLLLCLRDPSGGRLHELRLAPATPSPRPAGRGWWQALGVLACPLPPVALLMPTKKPRGEARSWAPHRPTPALHPRRLRMEQVTSRGKRCRMVQARLRRWQPGGRALVLARCGARHTCRVRLHPW